MRSSFIHPVMALVPTVIVFRQANSGFRMSAVPFLNQIKAYLGQKAYPVQITALLGCGSIRLDTYYVGRVCGSYSR